jgi:hypothetical protein
MDDMEKGKFLTVLGLDPQPVVLRVRLSPLGTLVSIWPLVPAQMVDDDVCGAVDGMTGRGNQSIQRNPAPGTLSTTNPTRPGGKPATDRQLYQLRYHDSSKRLEVPQKRNQFYAHARIKRRSETQRLSITILSFAINIIVPSFRSCLLINTIFNISS